MHKTADDLLIFLEQLGLTCHTFQHPPVFTVEESKRLRGPIEGAHCKSLFLKDRKNRFWLVVCLEHRRLDMKRLEQALDCARLSFGNATQLQELLGVTPGSVTPFGLINDLAHQIEPIFDQDMMAGDLLNFHPLRNDMTTQIQPAGLRQFLAAIGHSARMLDFATYGLNG